MLRGAVALRIIRSTSRAQYGESIITTDLCYCDPSPAIETTNPDIVIPSDDFATRRLHDVYNHERCRGNSGSLVCGLIERSLGKAESLAVVYARSTFVQLAEEQGVRVRETKVVTNTSDLLDRITRMTLQRKR